MALLDLRLVLTSNATSYKVKNVEIGKDFLVMAGPCSVESHKQVFEAGEIVKRFGANILRGGAYKPRTSPYAFQGMGIESLKILKEAGDYFDMPVVTEVMDTRDVELVSQYADILQVGARNTQNFSLLRELGKCDKPVLLKNGLSSTLEEWLGSAEYIMSEGNHKVILCERGIRTFEKYTRNTLDLSLVCAIKRLSNLPVIVDTSHGTGIRDLVSDMAVVSLFTGCDGLMLEVHKHPEMALSDGEQSLTEELFKDTMNRVFYVKKLYDTYNSTFENNE